MSKNAKYIKICSEIMEYRNISLLNYTLGCPISYSLDHYQSDKICYISNVVCMSQYIPYPMTFQIYRKYSGTHATDWQL